MRTHGIIGLVVGLLVSMTSVQGSVLRWNDAGVDWPTGALSYTKNNVNGSGINMTFTWSGDTAKFLSNFQADPTGHPGVYVTLPDDDPVTSMMPGVDSGLWYGTNGGTTGASVSLVITFSAPVSNVHLKWWDIDSAGTGAAGKEYLRLKGFKADNTAILPNLMSIQHGSDVNAQIVPIGSVPEDGVIFTNMGQYDFWPPYAANTAELTYDQQIVKIGMQFKNTDGSRGQILGDISFVPEPATMSLLVLGGLLGLRRRR